MAAKPAHHSLLEKHMDFEKMMNKATGGLEHIANDAMPASGIRPLIFDDPGLLWLEHHGEDEEGFRKDKGRYHLLPLLSKLGAAFEEAYIRNEAPSAVRLLNHGREVRKRESFEKTIEHLKRGTKFLWQAALWWYPEQVYAVADAIVHTSWLHKRYPHLRPVDDEPPHYVCIEFKYSTGLHTSGKRAHLEHASQQVRLQTYMTGQLQGFMAPRAYIISRDTVDAPIVIDCTDLKLGKPLDEGLADLRDAYLDIKLRGADLRPWGTDKEDENVRLNPQNKSDQPWHDAKVEILREKVRPRSLLMLPGVGQNLASNMHLHGFKDIDDLLKRDVDQIRFEDVDGIHPTMADRLRAVLKANKTGKPSEIPSSAVPKRRDVELFLDMEYLSSLCADFTDWPTLSGTPMVFMIGVRYKEDGEWRFKRFTAEEESHGAEVKMLRTFLSFLRKHGVFDPMKTVALYCWGSAEATAAHQAAQRHGLWQLENLPWVDLCRIATDTPICLVNQWSFGLKEVAEALGEYAPYYRVTWPEGLNSGSAAQIAAWEAYDDDEPLKTPEMRLIADYLSCDTLACERILAYWRNSSKAVVKKEASSCGWYRRAIDAIRAEMQAEAAERDWRNARCPQNS